MFGVRQFFGWLATKGILKLQIRTALNVLVIVCHDSFNHGTTDNNGTGTSEYQNSKTLNTHKENEPSIKPYKMTINEKPRLFNRKSKKQGIFSLQ